MKKVRVQYPLERKNPVLDGRIHDIEVQEMVIYDVNGETYYQLTYNDITAGNIPMVTFVKEVNGVMCKVPLKKYDYIKMDIFLAAYPRRVATEKEIDRILPPFIGLAETTTIKDIANNKPISSRNVTIQYPYSPINEGIDGAVHQITPIRLIRLNIHGLDMYFMEYFDHNLGHQMITFLIRMNGMLYKVPLLSYNMDEIREFLERYSVSEVPTSALFAGAGIPTDKPTIGLAVPMNLRDIVGMANRRGQKPVIEYPYYIPYNPENPMSISDRVFRSSCRIYQNGIEDFVFDKERNGNQIETAIRNEIQRNMDKIKRGESFFIDISVEIAPGTTVAMPTKDGRMVLAEYIPGIHKRRIFMTPNTKEKYEKPTKQCERLSIRTFDEDYGGYEDNPIVFRDGYQGKLPITFEGLPREYRGPKTFYVPQEHVDRKPIETEEPDYLTVPAIAELRNMYVEALNRMFDMIDGVALDESYIASYKETLGVMIAGTLREMGYSQDEIRRIIRRIDSEFIQQRNSTKKGL